MRPVAASQRNVGCGPSRTRCQSRQGHPGLPRALETVRKDHQTSEQSKRSDDGDSAGKNKVLDNESNYRTKDQDGIQIQTRRILKPNNTDGRLFLRVRKLANDHL